MLFERYLSPIYNCLAFLSFISFALLCITIGSYFSPWSYKNCSKSSDCNDSNPCTEDICRNFICEYTLTDGAECSNSAMCGDQEICDNECECIFMNPDGLAFLLPVNISTFVDIDSIKIAPNSATGNQRFGSAVTACGEFIFAGSERRSGTNGAVYIYDVSLMDLNLFAEEIQVLPGDTGSRSGFSLSISYDCIYLISGAPDLSPMNRGGFFIYKKNESADPIQYYLFQTVTTASTNELGFSVKISNNSDLTIMSGDPNNNNVKVFNYNSTLDQWQLVQTITGNGTIAGDRFGTSIDIIGDLAIIGATNQDTKGAAYIFERISGTWINTEIIRANDKQNGDEFGSCVSLYQGYAVVGAISATRNGISSGGAYLFNNSLGQYNQTQSIFPELGNTADFGASCSFNNLGCVLIGAPEYDSSLGNNIGIAIVYAIQNNQLVEFNRIIDYTIVVNGRIGSSVYMSDNLTIAGAPTYNNAGISSGIVLARHVSIPVFIQSFVDCFRYFPTRDSIRLWCQGNITGEFNPGIYYVVVDGSALPFNSSSLINTWHTFSAYGRSNAGNSLISVLNPQITVNNVFTAYIITYGSIEVNVVASSLRRITT